MTGINNLCKTYLNRNLVLFLCKFMIKTKVGILKKYKNKYSLYKINRDYNSSKRVGAACNLSDAKSIGLIYNATNAESFEIVKKFFDDLKEHVDGVWVLGYIDKKNFNDPEVRPHGFTFYNKKDVNWYNKPIGETAYRFIEKPFDILIDLDFDNMLAVKYVVVKSAAGFKVGRHEKVMPDFYDLSLTLDNDHKNSMSYFIEQVEVYLNMIKPN